jgi:hypothetical protein
MDEKLIQSFVGLTGSEVKDACRVAAQHAMLEQGADAEPTVEQLIESAKKVKSTKYM